MNYLTKSSQDNNETETIFEKKNKTLMDEYADEIFDFTKPQAVIKKGISDESIESLSMDELESKRKEINSHKYDFDFSKKSDDDLLESINKEITKRQYAEIDRMKREQIQIEEQQEPTPPIIPVLMLLFISCYSLFNFNAPHIGTFNLFKNTPMEITITSNMVFGFAFIFLIFNCLSIIKKRAKQEQQGAKR